MINLPEEHLEQMDNDSILWHGACHTETDYEQAYELKPERNKNNAKCKRFKEQ